MSMVPLFGYSNNADVAWSIPDVEQECRHTVLFIALSTLYFDDAVAELEL